MDFDLHAIAAFARELSLRAGELIRVERDNSNLEVSHKRDVELLTSADLQSEKLIHAEIKGAFPDHDILAEEFSPELEGSGTERPLWIVDPIDGTVNYAYGHHQVGICIAFALDGRVRAGVVHCPFQDETFAAVEGAGATLNGEPIEVSGESTLRRALIGTGFSYERPELILDMRRLEAVLRHCRDIRRIGSAAIDICWVAAGRLEGFYETLSPWDFAAAVLIAREAGGRVGHLGDVPDDVPADLYGRDLVVAAPAIYGGLVRVLKEASVG